jgi:hypothetical protein
MTEMRMVRNDHRNDRECERDYKAQADINANVKDRVDMRGHGIESQS